MHFSINLGSVAHAAKRVLAYVVPWTLAVVAVICALGSGSMFAAFMCVASGIFFLVAVKSDAGREQFHLGYYDCPRNTYFLNHTDFFVVGLAPVFAIFLSMTIYVPWAFAYSVVDRGDGNISYHQGFHVTFVDPLTVQVRHFSNDYSTNATCLAKTADGRGIRAKVGATLSLSFSDLPGAYGQAAESLRLGGLARSELCNRFAAVLIIYTVDSLPSRLSLESRTADERRGMNRLGLRYSGTIFVENMTAYVVQE